MPDPLPPNRASLRAAMAQTLKQDAQAHTVDLGDERSIELSLRRAGFDRVLIYRIADEAVEVARAALQKLGCVVAAGADAGAMILVVAVWTLGYVGLVR